MAGFEDCARAPHHGTVLNLGSICDTSNERTVSYPGSVLG